MSLCSHSLCHLRIVTFRSSNSPWRFLDPAPVCQRRQLKPEKTYLRARSPGGGALESSCVCPAHRLLYDSVPGGERVRGAHPRGAGRTRMLQFSGSLRANVVSSFFSNPSGTFYISKLFDKTSSSPEGSETQLRFLMNFSCWIRDIYIYFFFQL